MNMTSRKLWLDDERDAPSAEWMVCRTVEDARRVLSTQPIHEMSLDHDLGEGVEDGHDLLCWLEKQVWEENVPVWFCLPVMTVHSANPMGAAEMRKAIESIQRGWNAYMNILAQRKDYHMPCPNCGGNHVFHVKEPVYIQKMGVALTLERNICSICKWVFASHTQREQNCNRLLALTEPAGGWL